MIVLTLKEIIALSMIAVGGIFVIAYIVMILITTLISKIKRRRR